MEIKKRLKRRGFTLIELVVVIALMTMLALIIVPSLTAYSNKADDSKILANMKTVHTAAELVNQTERKLDKDKISKLSNNDNVSLDIVKDLERVYNTYYVEKQSNTIIVKHLDRNDKLHIYPKELANYTISFNTDGGNSIPSITQIYGSKVTKPKDPIKVGHVFGGWEPIIPTTIPMNNLEIKANWDLQKLTVQFNADGGIVSPEKVTTNYGSKVTLPTPTRLFYLFQGWYTEKDGEGDKVNSIEKLESSHTLYAKWKLDNIITRVKPVGTTSKTQTHKIPLDGVKTVNSVKVVSKNGGTAVVESIDENEITVKITGASTHDRTVQTGGVYTPAQNKEATDTKTSYGSNTNPNSVSYDSDGYVGTLTKNKTTTGSYQTGGTYTPSDSKQVTGQTSSSYNSGGYSGTLSSYLYSGSYTSGDSKYVSGQTSSSYNSGGYSGTLSSYLYSGSYTSSDTKYVSTTGYTQRAYYSECDGTKWYYSYVTTEVDTPTGSIYYSSGGYSGYIPENQTRDEYSHVWLYGGQGTYGPSGSCKKGATTRYRVVNTRYYYGGNVTKPASDTRVWRYEGTVTKPAVDTRVWRYEGTVTKPASDTRTYDTSYTNHYAGTVIKPASDTRTYDYYYDYEVEVDYSKD